MADTQIDKALTNPTTAAEYDLPREEGDFHLLECSVHSPSGVAAIPLNIPGRLTELNIFEDLFSNVLKGSLTMLDNSGLAEMIPLIGDEILQLSFLTPGGSGTQLTANTTTRDSRTVAEEAVKQRFKIYDCKETLIENKTKSYELFFVSEEYVFSSKMKVSKGYGGSKYSFIVKDVMTKVNSGHPFKLLIFVHLVLCQTMIHHKTKLMLQQIQLLEHWVHCLCFTKNLEQDFSTNR